ncbi:MAG: hypothetical protein QM760_05000 [Nibricoccus sp.]
MKWIDPNLGRFVQRMDKAPEVSLSGPKVTFGMMSMKDWQGRRMVEIAPEIAKERRERRKGGRK